MPNLLSYRLVDRGGGSFAKRSGNVRKRDSRLERLQVSETWTRRQPKYTDKANSFAAK